MTDEFVDNAYKTGAGRYLQQRGAIGLLGSEVRALGSKAFALGGPRSLPLVHDAVVSSLSAASVPRKVVVCNDLPTRAGAQSLAETARANGCDIVVGIGGGRMMDIAKAVACAAGAPVITVPTSIATCAAFSPLTVLYDESGKISGTWRFEREVDAVIADMDVLSRQPARLIAAGIMDAMAKKIEIENGGTGLDCSLETVQRYAAYQYACVNYELLERFGVQACQDSLAGKPTEALERIAFTNLALTGIVSSLTRGFHQTALAHCLYYGLRSFFGDVVKPWLHGELVAIGLLMQLVYNGAPEKTDDLRDFMRTMGMPCSLVEIGVTRDDARFEQLYDYVAYSEFVGEGWQWKQRVMQAFNEIA